jgi:type VI secretion system secreted protein Hcp
MAIYMEYDGIKGDVTEEGHKKWIECSSCQFGVGRAIGGTASGASRGREASLCNVSEITITKPADAASQDLMREAMIGAVPGKKVKFEFVTTGRGDKAETYTTFELENCMISGFSLATGGDRPSESLSLNFTKITYNMSQGGETGELDAAKRGYFDLALAKGG